MKSRLRWKVRYVRHSPVIPALMSNKLRLLFELRYAFINPTTDCSLDIEILKDTYH